MGPAERRLHSVGRDVVRSKVILLPSVRPSLDIGEFIEFELFDGKVIIGDVTQSNHHNLESLSWIGNLRHNRYETEDGFFSLSCVKSSCSAHLYISSSKSEFKIEPSGEILSADGSGTYLMSEIAIPKQKKSGTLVNPQFHSIPNTFDESPLMEISPDIGITTTVDTDLIIDIFVMYTPQAMRTASGT